MFTKPLLFMKQTLLILTISLIGHFFNSTKAEEKRIGDYIVYYNVFNSSFLEPKVASQYKIPRTGTTGVINVAIHRAHEPYKFDARKANVQGRATNNLSQFSDLGFREIKEDKAVYYLADFQFRPEENTRLSVVIRMPGLDKPIELDIDKTLYKD